MTHEEIKEYMTISKAHFASVPLEPDEEEFFTKLLTNNMDKLKKHMEESEDFIGSNIHMRTTLDTLARFAWENHTEMKQFKHPRGMLLKFIIWKPEEIKERQLEKYMPTEEELMTVRNSPKYKKFIYV